MACKREYIGDRSLVSEKFLENRQARITSLSILN